MLLEPALLNGPQEPPSPDSARLDGPLKNEWPIISSNNGREWLANGKKWCLGATMFCPVQIILSPTYANGWIECTPVEGTLRIDGFNPASPPKFTLMVGRRLGGFTPTTP